KPTPRDCNPWALSALKNYPARTRTWNEGIKIPSVTITLRGNWSRRYLRHALVIYGNSRESESAPVVADLLRVQNAVGHGESDLFEVASQVDPHDTDTAGDTEGHRGEVDNSADAGLDQLIGHALGMNCRNSNHAQFNLPVGNHFGQAIELADLDIFDVRA